MLVVVLETATGEGVGVISKLWDKIVFQGVGDRCLHQLRLHLLLFLLAKQLDSRVQRARHDELGAIAKSEASYIILYKN